MKKFFRLVSMLAVAGLTFAYTSCTDYSKDIDQNKEEIDALGGRLATVEQQVASLKTDVANLQTAKAEAEKAISALQTSLTTLQTKHDADVKKLAEDYAKADDALKAEIQKKIEEANAAHEKDVEAVKTLITALQTKVSDLETEVGKINETIKTLATKEYVDGTFATKDAVADALEKIGALRTDLTAAESRITALEGKYDSELKISEILVKIADAQKAADVADSLAKKALGDVDALREALGEYVKKGELEEKIALLNKADSTLKADKLNISDFNTEFNKALKQTLETEGNVVTAEIAKQITAAKEELNGQIQDLKNEINTKFNALFSISKQLKSLVFVPDLYVDGIEATEYTYAKYNQKTTNTTYTDDPVTVISKENVAEGVNARIPKGTIKDYTNVLNSKKTAAQVYYENPALAITYKMNPSTADVTAATPLSFVSYDKEYVSTKASVKVPEADFIKAENGELTVGLSSKALEQVLNANGIGEYKDNNLISIFALQATVKSNEGQDTTVTSDFARLYTSKLSFTHLAYKKLGVSNDNFKCLNQYRIYETLADAISHPASVNVRYDGTLDLDEIVTTHISLTRGMNENQIAPVEKEYITTFPNNEYNVTYKFDLIHYMLDENKTSETEHVLLDEKDGHWILTPCAITAEGKADSNATGAAAFTSVGRRPIVRVTMYVDGKFVLVGYIKLEIRKQTDYLEADSFGDWTYRFWCGGYENRATWAQMVDKVIKKTGYTKEEFVNLYELFTENNAAVQYYKVGEGFVRADNLTADQIKALGLNKVTHQPNSAKIYNYEYGYVAEISENVGGVNTSVLRWRLNPSDMTEIYQLDGNKVQIWVRYKYKHNPTTTEYDGIYVPLTAVADKPASAVSKKLSNYWFNGEASAKINVETPTKDTGKWSNATDPTKPWVSDIKKVWEGNKINFNFGENYKDEVYSQKFYFAPVQFSATLIGNPVNLNEETYYEFYVRSTSVVDKYLVDIVRNKYVSKEIAVTDNDQIEGYERKYSIDVNQGIYTNDVLMCRYISTEAKNEAGKDWKNYAQDALIAVLNQSTGDVTYNYGEAINNYAASDAAVAKFLLNYYESVHPQYTEAKLYANIGVAVSCSDDIAMSLKGSINPYHFLRPVNAVAVAGKYFIDSEDQEAKESNIDLFKLFTFKDWRGKAFFEEPVGEAAPDYSNLWYFKYYNISKVEVDFANVTTNLSGGILGETKLSAKTNEINLEHLGIATGGVISITTNVSDTWGENQYKGLVGKLGRIHYHNNGYPIDTQFTLRVPVSFTYTWGTINTYVDIEVLPLGSK